MLAVTHGFITLENDPKQPHPVVPTRTSHTSTLMVQVAISAGRVVTDRFGHKHIRRVRVCY